MAAAWVVAPFTAPYTILPPCEPLRVVIGVAACVPALQAQMQMMDNERNTENRLKALMSTYLSRFDCILRETAKNQRKMRLENNTSEPAAA
jgi:hypothetical protein